MERRRRRTEQAPARLQPQRWILAGLRTGPRGDSARTPPSRALKGKAADWLDLPHRSHSGAAHWTSGLDRTARES
eukprot:3132068-Pyramimonas_sp.AAC.1